MLNQFGGTQQNKPQGGGLFGGNQPTGGTGGSLFGGQPASGGNTGLFTQPILQKKQSLIGPSSGNQAGGLFTPKPSSFAPFQGTGTALGGGQAGAPNSLSFNSALQLSQNNQIGQPQTPLVGGGGLFGPSNGNQPPGQKSGLGLQQKSNSLFAQPATTGAVAQPNKSLLDIFGGNTNTNQPINTSPWNPQTPSINKQSSLFNPSQPTLANSFSFNNSQPAQPANKMFPQNQPQQTTQQATAGNMLPNQSHQQIVPQQSQPLNLGVQQQGDFYKLGDIWTAEMIQRLGQSMLRQNSGNLLTQTSANNQWNNQELKHLNQFPSFAKIAKVIADKFEENNINIKETKAILNKTDEKIIKLDTQIDMAAEYLQSIQNGQQTLSYQVQQLKSEMSTLTTQREQLGQQISAYQQVDYDQYGNGNELSSPSNYFFQLQQYHEKLIQQYEQKIQQAEVLAKVVSEQAAKSTPDLDGGNTELSFNQMKAQIYETCKLIYEQQKQTCNQLQLIERKTAQLRENFTRAMLKKQAQFRSYEEIDMLFHEQEQDNAKVNHEVLKAIKEIKGRKKVGALMHQFRQMEILKDDGGNKQNKAQYDELKRVVTTQILHTNKKSQETIKEKLEKGLYKKAAEKDTLFKSQAQYQKPSNTLFQGDQGLRSLQQQLLGRRIERNVSPSDEFVYLKRPNMVRSSVERQSRQIEEYEASALQIQRQKSSVNSLLMERQNSSPMRRRELDNSLNQSMQRSQQQKLQQSGISSQMNQSHMNSSYTTAASLFGQNDSKYRNRLY